MDVAVRELVHFGHLEYLGHSGTVLIDDRLELLAVETPEVHGVLADDLADLIGRDVRDAYRGVEVLEVAGTHTPGAFRVREVHPERHLADSDLVPSLDF